MTSRNDPSPADQSAWEALVESQRNGLLAMAMRLTRWDRQRSEDLVQAAYLRACSANAGTPSWTYLGQALKSAFIDDGRSIWRRWFTPMAKVPEIPEADPIVEKIHSGRIARALKDHLPEIEYLTLIMWAEGYSAQEICQHLGLPRTTYPHVLARAKKAAQDWLQRHDPARQQMATGSQR